MSCKWRTNYFSQTQRSTLPRALRWLYKQQLARPIGFALGIVSISALASIGSCTKAEAYSSPAAPVPDMTLENYSLGCSTSGCHQQLTETKWVHAPVATEGCAVCHQQDEHLSDHKFFTPATDSESCFSCHDFDDSPESIHEPFQLGTCMDCHDPHGGDRKSFIKTKTTQELCITCHDEVDNAFAHHPVNQGDCLTCHEAHQSKHGNLLTTTRSTLCLGCHQDIDHAGVFNPVTSDSKPGYIHQPVLEGGCMECHQPHGSDFSAMLINEQRAVCMECHEDITQDLPLAQSVHGPFESAQSCTSCHSPHSSDHEGLLAQPSNTLCFSCHDQEIESPSGATISNMKEMVQESPVVHKPAALGDCSTCHLSHLSPQHSLLRTSYPDKKFETFDERNYDMCFACHDLALIEEEASTITGFRQGQQNLHFAHVNREHGRACGICHQPHAGTLPKLMREEFPFGPGGWNLPIGFVQSPSGGTCISACHEQREYDNTILQD